NVEGKRRGNNRVKAPNEEKPQAPNPKFQKNSKLQIPSSREAPNIKFQLKVENRFARLTMSSCLVFEIWCFLGIWNLGFGVLFGVGRSLASRSIGRPAQFIDKHAAQFHLFVPRMVNNVISFAVGTANN